MIKSTQTMTLTVIVAGAVLIWSNDLRAAASGDLGVSASVMERCRIDFSEGSADYFQSCSSVEVKASGTASNVLGQLSAVDASADPYYLDRNPDSRGIAAAEPNTSVATDTMALAERKRLTPKVVTIHY